MILVTVVNKIPGYSENMRSGDPKFDLSRVYGKREYWELAKESDCKQRQRAAFVRLVESISREAQKHGQSRLRSCLASLGTTFGRAQKSLFLGTRLVFHQLLLQRYDCQSC